MTQSRWHRYFCRSLKRKIMTITLSILLLASTVIFAFMHTARFGKHPEGARLERIKNSPNWKDGEFQNQSFTPALTEGVSYYKVMKEFFFDKKIDLKPSDTIPNVKENLLAKSKTEDYMVWFGHSSYLMQLEGKTFLVDPVFSGNASPVSFTTKAFVGANNYDVNDLPEIDYLLISHDHWDHLDYETVLALKSKVKHIVCPLGVGAHLEHWGFDMTKVSEQDWYETVKLPENVTIHLMPARHFSGRGFKRNQSLWTSYVLEIGEKRIFIGGDSGYDKHFKEIGEKFRSFDLAILENVQYDKSWKYIHMMPEEVLQAAKKLHTKMLFPVHNSKFTLGNHPWYEPMERISKEKSQDFKLITPMIGQTFSPTDTTQQFDFWWKKKM
jgi:L-ascorbate metabolism protein UlaG (beta-lactamase superfamily)